MPKNKFKNNLSISYSWVVLPSQGPIETKVVGDIFCPNTYANETAISDVNLKLFAIYFTVW